MAPDFSFFVARFRLLAREDVAQAGRAQRLLHGEGLLLPRQHVEERQGRLRLGAGLLLRVRATCADGIRELREAGELGLHDRLEGHQHDVDRIVAGSALVQALVHGQKRNGVLDAQGRPGEDRAPLLQQRGPRSAQQLYLLRHRFRSQRSRFNGIVTKSLRNRYEIVARNRP